MIETQGIVSFAILILILAGVIVLMVRGIRAYHSPAMISKRPDQRIPKRERDLLGPDWTDRVSGYASVRRYRDETIARVVNGDDDAE